MWRASVDRIILRFLHTSLHSHTQVYVQFYKLASCQLATTVISSPLSNWFRKILQRSYILQPNVLPTQANAYIWSWWLASRTNGGCRTMCRFARFFRPHVDVQGKGLDIHSVMEKHLKASIRGVHPQNHFTWLHGYQFVPWVTGSFNIVWRRIIPLLADTSRATCIGV